MNLFNFGYARTLLLPLAVLLSCLAGVARSEKVIEISPWDTPGDNMEFSLPRGAVVGTTVLFTWLFGALHNVYIHPDKNCDVEGRIEIGLESGANYTFTEADVGKDIFFSCDAFDHCSRGLHVTFSVVATEEDLDELEAKLEAAGSASTPIVLAAGVVVAVASSMLFM
jgi:hypothetical protein